MSLSSALTTIEPVVDGTLYEPFDPALCVERKDEINKLVEKVKAGQKGVIPRPLVQVTGVVGLGKTWLLGYLLESLKNHAELKSCAKRPITAYADLRRSPKQTEYFTLLRSLAYGLEEQVRRLPDAPTLFPTTFQTPDPPPLLNPGGASRNFNKYVTTLSDFFVPILLFDTAEVIEPEFKDWLEDKVIVPLLKTDRVITVFAGRHMPRWKDFETRMRVEPLEITPFTRDLVQAQLSKLGVAPQKVPDLSAHLYKYSYGHPLATKALFRAVKGEARLEDMGTQRVAERKQELTEVLEREVVGRFYGVIQASSKSSVTPLLEAVCALRKFNPIPLSIFAEKFLGAEARPKGKGSYLDALREMQNTTLVEWSSARGGYYIIDVVRQILTKRLELRGPDVLRAMHEEALKLYEELMERTPRNAMQYLLETAYHRACLLDLDHADRGRAGSEIAKELSERLGWLKKNPDVQWDLPDMAATLNEELERDEELAQVIEKDAFEKIKRTADRFYQKVRQAWV